LSRALRKFHEEFHERVEEEEIYLREEYSISKVRMDSIFEILSKLKGERLLDVGCAEGIYT
jgi:2-polyprenyl-3-methyl-5-hydroxy-6-metoxy-1,4-benzoquinol methylase